MVLVLNLDEAEGIQAAEQTHFQVNLILDVMLHCSFPNC